MRNAALSPPNGSQDTAVDEWQHLDCSLRILMGNSLRRRSSRLGNSGASPFATACLQQRPQEHNPSLVEIGHRYDQDFGLWKTFLRHPYRGLHGHRDLSLICWFVVEAAAREYLACYDHCVVDGMDQISDDVMACLATCSPICG